MRFLSAGSPEPRLALLAGLLAFAAAPAVQLRGVVTDAAGRPAVARVTAAPLGRDQGTPPVLTDAAGGFALDLPAVATGSIELAAFGEAGFAVYHGPPESPLSLPLVPVRWVEGAALGPAREPLQQGEVSLLVASRPSADGPLRSLLTGQLLRAPIRQGRWRLPVPAETSGSLLATAPGLAPATGEYDSSGNGPLLVLRQAATLRGQVRAPDGGALAGVRVSVASLSRPSSLTDPAGRYELAGLAPGPAQVSFWHFGHGPWTIAETVTALLPAGGSLTLDRVAAPAGLVRVEVVDEETRRPVAGAVAGGEIADANGRLRLFLPLGRYELVASAAGWWAAPGSRATAEVAPGGVLPPVVLTLRRGRRLSGTVVDHTGRPVASAQVSLAPFGPATLTDAVGSFALADLPPRPGEESTLTASAGLGLARLTLRDAWPLAPLRLVLAPADSTVLRGRVTDEAGRPLPAARVSVRRGGAPLPSLNFEPGGQRQIEALSAADGSYRLGELPALPPLTLRVERDGYLPAEQTVRAVTPPETALAPATLRPVPPAVGGRVVNPDGTPAAGVVVAAGAAAMSLTDVDGQFDFPAGATGQLFALGQPGLRASVVARPGPLTLRLREALPPSRDLATERALAAELAEGLWVANAPAERVVGLLARLDPELALARADRLTPAAAAELPAALAATDPAAGLRLFEGLAMPPSGRLATAANLLVVLPRERWSALEPHLTAALAAVPADELLPQRAALAAAFDPPRAAALGRQALAAGRPGELLYLWSPHPQLLALLRPPPEAPEAMLEVVWLNRLAAGQPLLAVTLLRDYLDLWRGPRLPRRWGGLPDLLLRGLAHRDRAVAEALVEAWGEGQFGAGALLELAAVTGDPGRARALLELAETAARGLLATPAGLADLAAVARLATALDPPRQARLTAELTEIARNEALRGGPVPPLELALLVPDEAWLAAQRELAAAWSLPALQVLWSVDPEAAAELLTTRGLAPANLAVTLSFAEWLLRS